MIRLKRAYEPAAKGDGRRVLVERLWPRGVPKARLRLDEWAKDVAPSAALRRWFGHDPEAVARVPAPLLRRAARTPRGVAATPRRGPARAGDPHLCRA